MKTASTTIGGDPVYEEEASRIPLPIEMLTIETARVFEPLCVTRFPLQPGKEGNLSGLAISKPTPLPLRSKLPVEQTAAEEVTC